VSSLYLDESFLRQISARLERFKQVSPHRFNARCPICGDSQKSKSKARWHAFQHNSKGFLVCKCFNCGYTNSFDNFLKEIDPQVHKMYLMEKFRDANNNPQPNLESFITDKPKFDTSPLKKLKKISQLDITHPVRIWVANKRRIPSKAHYRLYYTPKFKKWTNQVLPGKFESEDNDEPRLVIPLFDKDGNMFAFQGRSFSNNSIRYVTIVLDDRYGRLYGLDTVDLTRTTYCVEGPLDSLFIDNAIASCGGDLVADLQLLNTEKDSIVVVYDNEPRNVDTVNKIEKAIELGYKVCIWPDDVEQKDINDMVLAGLDVEYILRRNIFQGLEANLRMTQWKKI
jgi:hypothetical protein